MRMHDLSFNSANAACIAAVLIFFIAIAATPLVAEGKRALVSVDTMSPGAAVPELTFGNNVKVWGSGAADMVWDCTNHRFYDGVIERLRPLGATMLRFPGGGQAEGYDWRAAVGKSRGGAGTRFEFGTDEFMELCRVLNATPIIIVNWDAGAKEAADWVEYCNGSPETPMGKLRAANGHVEPYGVRYWELGNEKWIKIPAKKYAESIPEFSRLMKMADPGVKLGGVGWAWTNWRSHYTKEADPWNETVLAIAGKYLDAFVIHTYCWIDPKPTVEQRNADLARTVLGWPNQMARELAGVKESFARAGVPDLPIWITEFNGYYGEQGMCRILGHTLNGVLIASMLNEFIRLGFPIVCNWDMACSGYGRFAAIANPKPGVWNYRPSWHVLSLYSAQCRGSLLPVAAEAPLFDHRKYSIVFEGKDTPGIDAVAVKNDGVVTVMLVNKLPDEAVATTISLRGSNVKRITAVVFSGDDPYSERCGVRDVSTGQTMPVTIPLPACSVTAVKLFLE
ncbi:MAG: hypothetical protein AABZ39_05085 [Spirochaetota bacterium]